MHSKAIASDCGMYDAKTGEQPAKCPSNAHAKYAAALGRHVVLKVLSLVLFLDQAKTSHIMSSNPPLFCKEAACKSTRDILKSFSSNLLRVGYDMDLDRVLASFGFTVSHEQRSRDDDTLLVDNLATGLRNGFVIARLAERLTSDWTLSLVRLT